MFYYFNRNIYYVTNEGTHASKKSLPLFFMKKMHIHLSMYLIIVFALQIFHYDIFLFTGKEINSILHDISF